MVNKYKDEHKTKVTKQKYLFFQNLKIVVISGKSVTSLIKLIFGFIIISNLSDDRSTASSKTIPPLNAI
jgi:hypothetical protein